MGNLTISMAIFHGYVQLPEGISHTCVHKAFFWLLASLFLDVLVRLISFKLNSDMTPPIKSTSMRLVDSMKLVSTRTPLYQGYLYQLISIALATLIFITRIFT